MGNQKSYLIQKIVHYCHKLDEKGFTANHDGNITVKFENHFLATPTSKSKADIIPEMVLELDENGKKISGIGNSFSEFKMHQVAYQTRREANAVVHAHPPYTMARGLVNSSFVVNVPEAVISIGDVIPVTPFVMPGTVEQDRVIEEAFQQSDIIMIPGNGVLAIGIDIEQAYLRVELLEHLIKIDTYARQMGIPLTLSEEDVFALMKKRVALKLGPQVIQQKYNSMESLIITPPKTYDDPIKQLIANELRQILKGDL